MIAMRLCPRLVLCAAVLILAAAPGFAATTGNPVAQAQALLAKNSPAQAAELLTEAVKTDPVNERLWSLLGRAQLALGRKHKAAEAWRMTLRLNPADTQTRMRLDMLGDTPLGPAPVSPAPAKAARGPSNLERAAQEELAAALAGDALSPRPRRIVIDPLQPRDFADDDALELAAKIAALLDADGSARTAVLTRLGPYPVRQAERAALAELFGASFYLALAAPKRPDQPPGIELVSLAREASSPEAGLAAVAAGSLEPPSPVPPAGAVEETADLLVRAQMTGSGAKAAALMAEAARKAGLPVGKTPMSAPMSLFASLPCPAVLVSLAPPPQGKAEREAYLTKLAGVLAKAIAELDP